VNPASRLEGDATDIYNYSCNSFDILSINFFSVVL